MSSKHSWEKSEAEISDLADNIMKDLEYNYRLPENIVTILIRRLNNTLQEHKIAINENITIEFGRKVESIINSSNNIQQEKIVIDLKDALNEAHSKTLDFAINNLLTYLERNTFIILKENVEKDIHYRRLNLKAYRTVKEFLNLSIDDYRLAIKSIADNNIVSIWENQLELPRVEFVELLREEFFKILTCTKELVLSKFLENSERTRKIIEEYIDFIKNKYSQEENINKYLLNPESHFENGHFLHSTQYYFAKRYFQSADNCDKLSILLANKVKSIGLSNITLVGFRDYTGLLLNKTKQLLLSTGIKLDYVIIEPMENNSFSWQFFPDFENINTNFVVVLPITCTCSTYIRMRKFLKSEIANYLEPEFPKSKRKSNEEWLVRRDFVNVFLIQDSRIKTAPNSKIIVSKERIKELSEKEARKTSSLETELSELYSDFNWERIEPESIYFKNDQYLDSYYIAHPLVKLYSDLKLPERCESCFPKENLRDEKNMFLTHDNFETPNLIQDFPDFGKERPKKNLLKTHLAHLSRKDLAFTKLFPSDNTKRQSHHYGHIKVNGSSYLNYIRGNTFFEQNKIEILAFFNEVLNEIITTQLTRTIKNIVFITSENKHNSTFLDEITNYTAPKEFGAITKWKNSGKANGFNFNVNILRIESQNEFIDNFMSNYINLLKSKGTLIIYFEEVFSAGKTFKLLSNYLKHYKNINHEEKELRHGFDYVFSLIDRTPYHTREEILKKLYSKDNTETINRFITYFKLNVPIVSAAHLGNPLEENVNILIQMVTESHLDVLKKRIGSELPNKIASKLPEENTDKLKASYLKYFPLEDESGNISNADFDLQKDILKNGKVELLKLYVAHEINSILANNRKDSEIKSELEKLSDDVKLVTYIVNKIVEHIQESKEFFFSSDINNVEFNLSIKEIEVVHDTVLKILSRHPFTYYTKIYDSIFKYCLDKMDSLCNEILDSKTQLNYFQVRKLKFYLRRLVDLGSSYLISEKFFKLMQYLYEFQLPDGKNRIEALLNIIDDELKEIVESYLITPWFTLIGNLKFGKINLTNVDVLRDVVFYSTRLNDINRDDLIVPNILLLKQKFNLQIDEEKKDSNKLVLELREKLKSKDKIATIEDISINDVLINNLTYKYNSIKSISSLLIYSFKESIYKNHYRSIKLEELLNTNHLLPKFISDGKRDSKNLPQNISEPYYLITGMIKAENLFLINKLKELHKTKYELYYAKEKEIVDDISELDKVGKIKEQQDKWLNPSSGESIKDYYFQSWKSDPIIINANKFIDKSRYAGDEIKHQAIKLSIANMLMSATRLTDKKVISDETSFLEEIKSVLKSVVDILQPGIKCDLGYALCVKYSTKTTEQNATDNIYVISSDESTNGSHILPNGLVYNLMEGLYSSNDLSPIEHQPTKNRNISLTGEQSLLTGIKSQNIWTSFANEYYVVDQNENRKIVQSKTFQELFQNDCLSPTGESGLPILSNSKMNLFFRLSELDEAKLELGNCNLEGKAILIITCSSDLSKSNYLDFMSNEKVRLLLLIKEELLRYLKKITDSSTFHELIKSKVKSINLIKYQRTLKHGLENYFAYQDDILNSYIDDERDKNIIETINQAIKGQISAFEITNNTKDKPYSIGEVIQKLIHILESEKIEGKEIKNDSYSIQFNKNSEFIFDSFIVEIILIELIINAKRHSPNVNPSIEITLDTNTIKIKNNKLGIDEKDLDKERYRQGLELCGKICDELKNYEMKIEGSDDNSSFFQITIIKK